MDQYVWTCVYVSVCPPDYPWSDRVRHVRSPYALARARRDGKRQGSKAASGERREEARRLSRVCRVGPLNVCLVCLVSVTVTLVQRACHSRVDSAETRVHSAFFLGVPTTSSYKLASVTQDSLEVLTSTRLARRCLCSLGYRLVMVCDR